jgi:hypothetical protein
MTNTDLHDEIPGVEFIVDLTNLPPQRLAKVEYDTNTLIALVDIADAAAISGGKHTRDNAVIFRDFALRLVRELESRSLIDQKQWDATEHLAAAE